MLNPQQILTAIAFCSLTQVIAPFAASAAVFDPLQKPDENRFTPVALTQPGAFPASASATSEPLLHPKRGPIREPSSILNH